MKLRFGIISNIDNSNGLFKVKFEEDGIVSGWLSRVQSNTKVTKSSVPLDTNERVVVLMDEHLERGVILGAYYSKADQPSLTSGKYGIEFPGGNKVEYDPATNKLTVVASGKVEITGDVKITGKLDVTGNINANGEVKALAAGPGVKLSTHIHPETGANTSPPTPGT